MREGCFPRRARLLRQMGALDELARAGGTAFGKQATKVDIAGKVYQAFQLETQVDIWSGFEPPGTVPEMPPGIASGDDGVVGEG